MFSEEDDYSVDIELGEKRPREHNIEYRPPKKINFE